MSDVGSEANVKEGSKGKPPRPASAPGPGPDRPKIPRPKKTSTQLRTEGRELLSGRASKDRRLAPDSQVEVANDPDVQAMGKIIEGAKVYVLLAVCVVSRALAVVLLKDAMEHLETPLFLVFSHQISVLVLLLILKAQNIATVPRLTVQQAQSMIPVAIMESLEMMLFFSSLTNGSVLFVVTLTSVISAALIPWASRAVLSGLSMGLSWDSRQLTAIIFAATGAAIELAMHERPNLVTTVSLSLWCVVRAVHCLWLALRDGPHTLQSTPALLRMLPAETVQKVLETAQTPPPPPMARALYQNAISCLPVLTLGLVFQEGPELMAHEVTVPSITTVLLSAACFAVAEATRLAAKCSETVAAAIDGAYMVSLAAVVVWADPTESLLHTIGMLLAALGLFVLRRTAEPPLPKSSAARCELDSELSV